MSTPLSLQVPTDSLKTIASALPSSLADKVISSQVEQVFVWVIKDSENAAKIVSILQDAGFKNVKVDSKGNTITAQASVGVLKNASLDKPSSTTTTISAAAAAAAPSTRCDLGGGKIIDCYYPCSCNTSKKTCDCTKVTLS